MQKYKNLEILFCGGFIMGVDLIDDLLHAFHRRMAFDAVNIN